VIQHHAQNWQTTTIEKFRRHMECALLKHPFGDHSDCINHWDCGAVLADLEGLDYNPNLSHKQVKMREGGDGTNKYLRGEQLLKKITENCNRFSSNKVLEESLHP